MRVLVTRVAGHDQTSDVNLVRLKVCGNALQQGVHVLARGDAVVADQRECDDEDLAAVRGVGDGLGVAYHASLEDQFASNALVGAEALSKADMAILELKSQVLGFIWTRSHNCGSERQLKGYGTLRSETAVQL